MKELYRAQEDFGNLGSARQSKIDLNERWPCTPCKASEKDRFGKAAASQNSQNLTERGIQALAKEAENIPSIDPELFYAHAFAHYQAGRTEDAAEAFRILCARFPLEARFWFGLASSCQESGDYEKALHAWAMSALLDPTNPYPHFHAAECSTSLNHKEDSLLALETAKTLLDSEAHPLALPISALEDRWRAS